LQFAVLEEANFEMLSNNARIMKSQKWTMSFFQARMKKILIGLEDPFHEKTKMMQP